MWLWNILPVVTGLISVVLSEQPEGEEKPGRSPVHQNFLSWSKLNFIPVWLIKCSDLDHLCGETSVIGENCQYSYNLAFFKCLKEEVKLNLRQRLEDSDFCYWDDITSDWWDHQFETQF